MSVPAGCKVLSSMEKAIKDKQSDSAADFLICHNSFLDILGQDPRLEELLQFDDYPFAHEASVYFPSSRSLFVTSNQYRRVEKPVTSVKQITISRLNEREGRWQREELDVDVPMPNGGVNYRDGNRDGILFCAQGSPSRRGGLVWMQADAPYRVRTLLDNFQGRIFNSLNDVVVHSDGSIWFTDPIYGFEQDIRPRPQLPNQVYRYDPRSGDLRAIADGFGRPNGICFSPDEKTVYITDTEWLHGDSSTDDTRAHSIYAFDLIERYGSPFLTNRRLFAMAAVGVPDGIKCDLKGNVYSGCGDGVNVWNPGGTLIGKIMVPGGVANFCFGEAGELFLLNEHRVFRVLICKHVHGALLRI